MDYDKIVLIRTDANPDIASGHLVRCITIAKAVLKQGGKVRFLISDDQSRQELLQRFQDVNSNSDVTITVLGTSYKNMEQELPVLKDMLSGHSRAVILVDSYYITPYYLQEVRKLAKVYYLDDLQMFDYAVDGVINYDICVDGSFYKSADKIYLEGEYAPLREQFTECEYEVRCEAKELLLTTGGTDPTFFCEKFIRGFLKQDSLKDWRIHLIVGSMFENKEALAEIARNEERVLKYENVDDMARLMMECDVAVSAGGTTLFELCAVGLPTISISISSNQIPCNEAFAKADIIPYAGHIITDEETNAVLLERMYAKVMELGSNLSNRQEMSLRQKAAVDGKGADRIASLLLCQ